MAKKKKKKKAKKSGSWFSFGSGKKLTKQQSLRRATALRMTLISAAAICVVAALCVGFFYLDKYVIKSQPIARGSGPLKIDTPEWAATEAMKERIASVVGQSFRLEKGAAEEVARDLDQLAWVYDVKVKVGSEAINVTAKYRRPMGLVTIQRQRYYVAWAEAGDPLYQEGSKRIVVLDHLTMDKIAVVPIKGFSARSIADIGSIWYQEDVTAAAEILRVLTKMDRLYPDKGLMEELEYVDVSNFGGRKSSRKPHIILYAKDGTQIWWGTVIGEEAKHLEPAADEKAAKLYKYFSEEGTVLNRDRYIELRHMQ